MDTQDQDLIEFENYLEDYLCFSRGEKNYIRRQTFPNNKFAKLIKKINNSIDIEKDNIKERNTFIYDVTVYLDEMNNGHFNEKLEYIGKDKVLLHMAHIINDFSSYLSNLIIEINQSLSSVSNGDFDKKMIGEYDGEYKYLKNRLNYTIGSLGKLTNHLEDKINESLNEIQKKDKQLAQQSKLVAMGEMVGSIAHQWRQPLNALAGNVQLIELDYEDELVNDAYIKTFIDENMKLINFMSNTINDFRDFFKIDKTKQQFNLRTSIESTISLISAQIKQKNINIEMDVEDEYNIVNFESEFKQVVLNIITNAKDEFREENLDNIITISIKKIDANIYIQFIDNAGGIPEDIISRIFEPYYTTKDQGDGTGLGLYMSKMIIETNMNGQLSVYNNEKGATFEISLIEGTD